MGNILRGRNVALTPQKVDTKGKGQGACASLSCCFLCLISIWTGICWLIYMKAESSSRQPATPNVSQVLWRCSKLPTPSRIHVPSPIDGKSTFVLSKRVYSAPVKSRNGKSSTSSTASLITFQSTVRHASDVKYVNSMTFQVAFNSFSPKNK